MFARKITQQYIVRHCTWALYTYKTYVPMAQSVKVPVLIFYDAVSGADPGIYFGGAKPKSPIKSLRAKPESRARSARSIEGEARVGGREAL